MTENANKPDIGKVVAEIQTLQVFVDDFLNLINDREHKEFDERLYKVALDFSSFSFSELTKKVIGLSRSESGSFEQIDNMHDQFEQLRSELNNKDAKIQEFKLSLADTVIEGKNLQKRNSELLEEIAKLQREISHLQLHSKELSMKLSAAEGNLKNTQSSFSSASEELKELRDHSYGLKNRSADLEDQIRDLEKELNNTNTQNATKTQEIDRLQKLSDRLTESFEGLKIEHQALSERSSELEGTIDALQKEKNQLHKRLDNLLLGLPQLVSYSPPSTSKSEKTILEPRSFAPFIPFCFPEKVPTVIHFKRDLKQNFGKIFPRNSRPEPKVFPQDFKLKFEVVVTRVFATKKAFKCHLSKDFDHVFKTDHQIGPFALNNAGLSYSEKPFKLIPNSAILENAVSRRINILQKSSALAPYRHLNKPENPQFGIHTNSFDLLLSYLSRSIFESQWLTFRHPEPLFVDTDDLIYKDDHIEQTNIFYEKLAFRYGYQLKSIKLSLHRIDFVPSFKRGTGLRSVLETFGNTINSMVKRYDVFSAKKTDKSVKNKD